MLSRISTTRPLMGFMLGLGFRLGLKVPYVIIEVKISKKMSYTHQKNEKK